MLMDLMLSALFIFKNQVYKIYYILKYYLKYYYRIFCLNFYKSFIFNNYKFKMNKKLVQGKNKLFNSQSNSNLKNVTNSNKEKNFNTKRNLLIQKVHLFLKNKYSKLFRDKDYSETNLLADLNSLISNEDLKKFDYNAIIIKVEKNILEIIKNKETKSYQGLPDMSKINSLIAISTQNKEVSNHNNLKKEEIEKKNSDPNFKINLLNEEKYNHVNSKQDEWALIAKYNDIKHHEEMKNKKIKENEQKMKQKEFLEKQIQEKEALKIKEKEDLRNFYNAQIKKDKQDIPLQKHSKSNSQSQLSLVPDSKINAKSNIVKYENTKYIREQEEKEKS
jgi:hypothetical protein